MLEQLIKGAPMPAVTTDFIKDLLFILIFLTKFNEFNYKI